MLDIGVGSILTKGLGGPACNLLIFGPFRLYIEPFGVTPTPTVTSGLTPTPTPTGLTPTPTVTSGLTPTPSVSPTIPFPSPSPSGGIVGGGGGGIVVPRHDDDEDDDELQKYKLTFSVKFRKRNITRTFIVDSFKKDKIIKRVGKINTVRIKFKVAWDKVTNNRFTTRWKK